METLIAHPQNEAQEKAVKAIFEALQVPYETEPDTSDSPYNPEFVAMILQADKDFKNGKGKEVNLKEFFNLEQ